MLFNLRTDTACDTADLLHQAAGAARSSEEGDAQAAASAAAEFVDVSESCADAPLRAAIDAGHVTFVHLDRAQQAAAAGAAAAASDAEDPAQKQQQQQGKEGASQGGADTAQEHGVESLEVEEECEGWGAAE
jgi:pyruvate/2-oxoglutarate dehydrogenase complex dihydrolipoamide acyltransferase (E2) component